MRIKNTHMQLEAIAVVMTYLVAVNQPVNLAEKFVYRHVYKLYTKIRNKVELPSTSNAGYGFTLTPEEAMALALFLQHIPLPTIDYKYECIQLDRIAEEIRKEYGS